MLKQLASAGVLASATVEPSPTVPGAWVVNAIKTDREVITVTLAGDETQVKNYVRLNAALMDVHRLGIREVSVRLPEDFERDYGPRNASTK
ncbi:hypothetical protein D3C85_1305330 [compost metagenome]